MTIRVPSKGGSSNDVNSIENDNNTIHINGYLHKGLDQVKPNHNHCHQTSKVATQIINHNHSYKLQFKQQPHNT